MKILVFTLFIYQILVADESFITKDEYAASLYHNPRGIGCNNCHGEKGEGALVANYKHKGVYKSFSAPEIRNENFQSLYKALHSRVRGMPRYFLTREEIEVLYYYLKSINDINSSEVKDDRGMR